MLKQTAWLVKKEIKYSWLSFFLTIVFVLLIAYISSSLLEQAAGHLFGSGSYNKILTDVIFILVLPSLGSVFISSPYLSYRTIKEDPFSKRMAFMRALPISVGVLALSRTIMMIITLVINSIVFYGTLTLMLPSEFFQTVLLAEYFIFCLMWFSYTLAFGGMNPFIEYGTNGKVLHVFPIVFIGVLVAILIGFYNLFEHGIIEYSLLIARQFGFIAALIPLFISICVAFLWNRLLTNRLLKRDYL